MEDDDFNNGLQTVSDSNNKVAKVAIVHEADEVAPQ